MTAIPLLTVGAETPVEGQPLLTIEVVGEDMRKSALRRNLESIGREFYCKCICDPLFKLKRKIPTSLVKLGLILVAGMVILICLTMLEVVGAHRQGELQHALKERLRFRNFTDETMRWVMQHKAAAAIMGQYGQRLLSPYSSTDNNSSDNTLLMITSADLSNVTHNNPGYIINNKNNNMVENITNSDFSNDNNSSSWVSSRLLRVIGMDRMHQNVLDQRNKLANLTQTLTDKIKNTFT